MTVAGDGEEEEEEEKWTLPTYLRNTRTWSIIERNKSSMMT